MIHTFEVYTVLTGTAARQLLCELGVARWQNSFVDKVNINGIAELKLWQRKKSSEWLLRIVVNPAKLLYGFGAFETIPADEETLGRLDNAFVKALSKLSELRELPKLSSWLVSRIDYAVDVKTPHVKACVLLAKKGDKPSWYKDNYCKDGSCYWSCESSTGNIYDKMDAIIKHSESPEMVKRAEDILRVEVQCNSPKVSYLRNKNNIDSRDLKHFFNGELARDVLMSYCRRIFKLGDYHSYDAASKLMGQLSVSKRQKTACGNLLKAVAQARSINQARKQLSGEGLQLKNTVPSVNLKLSPVQFSRNCRKLADMNINPVTIPREWKQPNLPSIAKLIEPLLPAIEIEVLDNKKPA